MSLHPYRDEELNHFKCLSLVLNEFPKALRQTFKTMWDTTIGHRPGYQLWDDSTAVRNLFVSKEGGTTKIPTHQSYNGWDCTALFQATIFANSFRIHSKTLNDLYVKPRAVPHGSFHGSVLSPKGDNAETFALAIDQLRRLRNTVCHSSRLEMDKATFDQNIQYAKEAFKALGISTASIDAIGSLTASDFPTTEVRKLEQQVREEKQAYIKCLENRNADMEKIDESLASIKKEVENLTANKEVAEGLRMQQEDISALGKKIHDLKKKEEERYKEAGKTGKTLGQLFSRLFLKTAADSKWECQTTQCLSVKIRQKDRQIFHVSRVVKRKTNNTSHIKINETVTIQYRSKLFVHLMRFFLGQNQDSIFSFTEIKPRLRQTKTEV